MPHDDIPAEKAGGSDWETHPGAITPPAAERPTTTVTASDSALPPEVAPTLDTGYTTAGVPTFEGVREKIETRYGTALGSTELAEETVSGRAAEQQFEARKKAAAEKLEEIRASMHEHDGKA